jgi:hypothetical protein
MKGGEVLKGYTGVYREESVETQYTCTIK